MLNLLRDGENSNSDSIRELAGEQITAEEEEVLSDSVSTDIVTTDCVAYHNSSYRREDNFVVYDYPLCPVH